MNELILLVDDNVKLLQGIRLHLEMLNYRILIATTGVEALEILERSSPSLIVSDIRMPEMNGIELFKQVRAKPHLSMIPFIFLTALSDELEINDGKSLGADDYIVKPFKTKELVSSIQGRLRRKKEIEQAISDSQKEKLPEHIQVHDLEIFPNARQVFRSVTEILLSPIEFELLLHFIQYPGKVCPFSQLEQVIYPTDFKPIQVEQTIRVHVNNLRKKLKVSKTSKNIISNIRGIGYRFEKE
jgi:DNA-binding response OmpR family regulator